LGSGKTAVTLGAVDKKYLTGRVTESIRAAQSSSTDTAGGFIAPAAFSDRVQQIIAAHDPIYDLAQELVTVTGTAVNYPTVDDPSISAVIKAQNANSDLADVTFGKASLPAASTYRSGIVLASSELVTDSYFNLDSLLATTFGFRLARKIGADFTGTLLSGAPTAITAAATTTITDGEVWSLIAALDEAYASNAAFVMKKSTYAALAQIKGTSGNYVLDTDRDSAGRLTLCGFPCHFSPAMGAMTAALKPIAFGDFSAGFVKRVVRNSFVVARLDERYAEYSEVGFQASLRVSGAVVQGGNVSPIVLLGMHA
jgi:HK97 family phage major capsid protein